MRRILLPLALTQFVASFAGSSMNVSISSISEDLDTTVHGVQTAITLFLLCMAALMIPGSKLTDIWGRKRCLTGGLTVYGIGAVVAALAPGLGVLVLGYSAFEGVGSALMIPPIYILATMLFGDLRVACPSLRRDQRHGRHRRGGRTSDRRSDHDRDQLARYVPSAGGDRRTDRAASAAGSSIRCRPTGAGGSTRSVPCCRQPACSSS